MKERLADNIARKALRSMLYEVSTAPKPGLVDAHNNGAHSDMDIFTFIDSSATLYSPLRRCAMTGIENPEAHPANLLSMIRSIGLSGEREMLHATGGVNTQKGLFFSLGVICAATGHLKGRGKEIDPGEIRRHVMIMAKGLVEHDLLPLHQLSPAGLKMMKLTAGQKLYLELGITGIRGEVEAGFPTAFLHGLPILQRRLAEKKSLNDALLDTLLTIMTEVEDANVIWRSGHRGLDHMRRSAAKVLALGGASAAGGYERLKAMNGDFTRRNISPGGSADLLAVTVMFHLLMQNSEVR